MKDFKTLEEVDLGSLDSGEEMIFIRPSCTFEAKGKEYLFQMEGLLDGSGTFYKVAHRIENLGEQSS